MYIVKEVNDLSLYIRKAEDYKYEFFFFLGHSNVLCYFSNELIKINFERMSFFNSWCYSYNYVHHMKPTREISFCF